MCIGIDYYSLGVFFIHNSNVNNKDEVNHNMFGISLTPINIEYRLLSLRAGVVYLFKNFPEKYRGAKVNYTIALYFDLTDWFSVGYFHLSNGFRLFHNYNPGMDAITLKINISKILKI